MGKSSFCVLVILILILDCLKSQNQTNDTVIQVNPINFDKNIIENASALSKTFQLLNSIKTGNDSKFVVVHFGDSHIQMGHFSGTFEANLQSVFGSGGSGVLFPYSSCKSVGPSNLKASFEGIWDFNNITLNANKIPLGIKGYAIKTSDTNSTFELKYISDESSTSSEIKNIRVFHGVNNFKLVREISKIDSVLVSEPNSTDWETTNIYTDLKSSNLKFKLKRTDSTQTEFVFHGVLFENSSKRGVLYHQCGVVGAQFYQIVKKSPILVSQLSYLKPNLIIFSYGSNETYMPNFDSVTFIKDVTKFIEKIKAEIPGVEILITSAPDTKSNNRFPIHKNAINRALRKIATKTNTAFWDLDAVMGGDHTMDIWRANGLAQKDKLHFFKSGYALQGNLLSMAFFSAFNSSYPNSINTDNLQTEIKNQSSVFTKKVETIKPDQSHQVKTVKHIVKSGDTLTNLAKKYHCSIESIKKLNNLTSSVIRLGEELSIEPNQK